MTSLLLNDLDVSIRNKFLKLFLNGNDENEEGYEKAFINLYEKVVEIINDKTKEINSYSNKKIEFLKFQNYFLSTLINESLDLSGDLNNIIAEVEDVDLKKQIQYRIAQFEDKINYKENIEKFNNHLNDNVIKLMLKID